LNSLNKRIQKVRFSSATDHQNPNPARSAGFCFVEQWIGETALAQPAVRANGKQAVWTARPPPSSPMGGGQ